MGLGGFSNYKEKVMARVYKALKHKVHRDFWGRIDETKTSYEIGGSSLPQLFGRLAEKEDLLRVTGVEKDSLDQYDLVKVRVVLVNGRKKYKLQKPIK